MPSNTTLNSVFPFGSALAADKTLDGFMGFAAEKFQAFGLSRLFENVRVPAAAFRAAMFGGHIPHGFTA